MKLICVRHGETGYNFEGRIQGQNEAQLSPLGWRQAQATGQALRGIEFDVIIASPLRRAIDSARKIGEALGVPVETDDRLKELHAGVFTESCWTELDEKFPADAVRWRSGDPDYRIPGGESRRDLMIRSQACLVDIRERGYRAALVVAHGGSIAAAFKALLEIPAHRSPFVLSNCSISTVLWEKEFRLLTVNDTSHLREVHENGEL